MADDRMKDDDLQKKMGTGEGQKHRQQTPGRNLPDDDIGQRGQQRGGQQVGGQNIGQQKKGRNLDEDEFGGATSDQSGGQTRGGQNRYSLLLTGFAGLSGLAGFES